MDSHQFYRSIFPSEGLRVLAVFKNGLKLPPSHFFYESDADLIEAAETYSGLNKNVYHACAVFESSESRKGDNAKAAKSLWVDLDTGPTKPYSTRRDAAAAIEAFRAAVGLQPPHFVSSGGGLHVYFPMAKAITPEQWGRLAALFAACLDHYGVKHDTSRTEDVASILRVPGTNNYKTDTPRAVKLIRLGQEEPAADLYAKLKAYADTHKLLIVAKAKGKTAATNDLVGTKDYPPSEGPRITAKCAVLDEVEATGGDVEYPIWWAAMGVAKHTTDPDGVAAHWTRRRAATGHDKHDWKGTMDAWGYGPTTCAKFSEASDKCSSCPHFGKITSPIQLGTPEEPPVDPNAERPAPPTEEWTFKAQWILDRLSQQKKVGYKGAGMTMSVSAEEGGTKYVQFSTRYWQVLNRVRSVDGVWQLLIGYEEYGNVKTFLMDSASVTSPDLLRKAFSAREIHIVGGQRAMSKAQEILVWEQEILHSYNRETTTYPNLGWTTVENTPTSPLTGEFVIGKHKYRPGMPPVEVEVSDRVDRKFVVDFRTSGTTDEWVAIIDRVYNREGAEAYQFIIAAMFAAPLIKLSSGGEWHGIPIGLTGDSGAAKTTTAMVANSVYGPPALLRFNGNASKDGGQGDTPTALAIKMGSLNNLPFTIDEVTSVESAMLAQIMFMLSAGRPKDRAESSGKKLVENNHRWDTVSIITGNDSLHERLRELRRQNTQDATMLRCFEVPIFKRDLKRVFFDVHRTTIEDELLKEQYGCVGREWIQFVVDNRETITKVLLEQRKKFQVTDDDMSDIRFYKDLLINVQVAMVFAKKQGFLRWDPKPMMKWARDQLLRLRDSVNMRDWEGNISDFVASLYGRTIVSKKMKIGRGRRSTTQQEAPLEPLTPNKAPVARKAIDDRIFVVTANAVREWCIENRVVYSAFLQEMHQRGYIKAVPGAPLEKPRLINIGSGTTVSRPQAPCFEFDYEMVTAHQEGEAAGGDNVVQFPEQSVTPAVTEPVEDAPASL